jgi:hypothetical protein
MKNPQVEIDEEKLEKRLTKIHKLFQGLTVPEILIAYGNLGYHLGASLAGFSSQEFDGIGPDEATLSHEYYKNPTIDVALMIQGLQITTWEKNFYQKPVLSNLAERYRLQELAKTKVRLEVTEEENKK